MAIINLPVLFVPDPIKGKPLALGQIFVGEPDLDPQIPANQKQLSIVQEDGTVVPQPQPFILSAGGVPVYNGSTVRLDVAGNYSLKILDRFGAQKYFIDNVLDSGSIVFEKVILSDTQTTVNLLSVSTLTGVFYIQGQNVDRGLLTAGDDYTVTGDLVIELKRSYPAGSSIAAFGGIDTLTGDVVSVYGRTGAVVSVAGDYNVSQITNTPTGNITAVEQQAVNAELDAFISTNTVAVTKLKKRTPVTGASTTPVGFDYFATVNATITMDNVTGFTGGERFTIAAAKGIVGSTLTVDGTGGEVIEPANGDPTDTVFNLTTVGVSFEFIFNAVTGNWEV